MFTVLLADDNLESLKNLKGLLEKEGYDVRVAFDGKQAHYLARKFSPDVVIADVKLPEMDGFSLCQALRQEPEFQTTLIILLSETNNEWEEMTAFDCLANAYLSKPLKSLAFLSRLKGLLRRKPNQVPRQLVLDSGKLVVEPTTSSLQVEGNDIHLPSKTFEIFMFLASNPETVYSRDELLLHLWGSDDEINARTIDVHIRKIRQKMGERYIHTIKGVGYKFKV